jgi:hypothetical protein
VDSVVACLPADVADQARTADPRQCTHAAYESAFGFAAPVAPPSDAPPVDGGAVISADDVLARLVAAGTGPAPDADAVIELGYLLQSVPASFLSYPEVMAAAVTLWCRDDLAADTRTALSSRLPSGAIAAILTAVRRWSVAERGLFHRLAADCQGSLGQQPCAPMWEVLRAGPPQLDVADPADMDGELGGTNRPFSDDLLRVAAGATPNFAWLSRALWAEHTGAALLWASRMPAPSRADVLAAHREFTAAASRGGPQLERPSTQAEPTMRLLFTELGDDAEMRVALSAHCRNREALAVWFAVASPDEVEAWCADRRAFPPAVPGDVAAMLHPESGVPPALAASIAETCPGLPYMFRYGQSWDTTEFVLRLLAGRLGEDPDRWRTAFEILDEATSVADLAKAVAAVHGPLPDAPPA